eukprot:166904-Pyramimonas_sp.AAC.1
MLDPPAGLDSGDSFTDRSPSGMARLSVSLRRTSLSDRHYAGPPSRPRKWRRFHLSQPSRDGDA